MTVCDQNILIKYYSLNNVWLIFEKGIFAIQYVYNNIFIRKQYYG